MRRVSSLVGVAAAVIAAPFMGLPAWGLPCVTAPVSTYTAPGFSCSVGDKTFSDIVIAPTATGNASVTLTSINPIHFDNEFGLELNYLAIAATMGASDVAWSYDVTSTAPMIDAFLQLTGSTTGTGQIAVTETLSNGGVLSLTNAGTVTTTFMPTTSLHVSKDQVNFSGANGFAEASILDNAVSQVPGPIAGAGLPGLILACGTLLILARRRRQIAC